MPNPGIRPFTRAQALENAAFLTELRRTGNVRDACRVLGRHRATFTKRRARHPAFAADWDAALVVANANLKSPSRSGVLPQLDSPDRAKGGKTGLGWGSAKKPESVVTGTPQPTRTKSGRLQLRRPTPDRLTRAHEQAFLAALSATANVRLSAAAAGFSHSAFYHRRKRSPAFAREFRLALEQGYATVEAALMESFRPDSYADDAWRHNESPAMPKMTVDQGLQLLALHQKEARLLAEPPHLKRRRGESKEAWQYRMAEMYREGQRRAAEQGAVALAARGEGAVLSPHEPPAPVLPALDQVTGWSKAGR